MDYCKKAEFCCENSQYEEKLTKEQLKENIRKYQYLSHESWENRNKYDEKVRIYQNKLDDIYIEEIFKNNIKIEGSCLCLKEIDNVCSYIKIIKVTETDLKHKYITANAIIVKFNVDSFKEVEVYFMKDRLINIDAIVECKCSEDVFNEAYLKAFKKINDICSNNSKCISYDKSASLIERMDELDKKK